MRIIVLQGMPENGKTRTLLILYTLLLNLGALSTKKIVLNNFNDISDVLEFRGLRIAFFTMGDYSDDLTNAISDFDAQNCDLMICAISTNTPKTRANNKLNWYNAMRINKTIAPTPNDELAINTADAQIIFNQI